LRAGFNDAAATFIFGAGFLATAFAAAGFLAAGFLAEAFTTGFLAAGFFATGFFGIGITVATGATATTAGIGAVGIGAGMATTLALVFFEVLVFVGILLSRFSTCCGDALRMRRIDLMPRKLPRETEREVSKIACATRRRKFSAEIF